MKFITLTQLDYNKTLVEINPEDISSFESRPGSEHGTFTVIFMKNGKEYQVKETSEEIKKVINS